MYTEMNLLRTLKDRRGTEGVALNLRTFALVTNYNNGGSSWQTKPTKKPLFVTCKEQYYMVSCEAVHRRDDLKSSQEEADTRLELHAHHAAREEYKSVVIVSEETDVFVICLAFQTDINSRLYQKCGTQTRYVDITIVVQALEGQFCEALPGLHAFTGCDSVGAFAGRGMISALNMVRRNKVMQEVFQQLGSQ